MNIIIIINIHYELKRKKKLSPLRLDLGETK